MIKYIGSKRTLVPLIAQVVQALSGPARVLDLFSGTSRVGHALKSHGYAVDANDHNAYASTLARCYVQADAEQHLVQSERLLKELSRLPGTPGYFTNIFCEQSRFFQPKNGERIDAIREAIERKDLEPELKAIVLVSLMEAADRVDSTTGVQMAYLKDWAPRAFNDLELRVPAILPRAVAGKGHAHQMEALDAVSQIEAEICYLDPPYNQHKYLGNYHIWESLVLWDKPPVYGVACKRVDCRERSSAFNSRPQASEAFGAVLRAARARHLVVSFNNEGYFTRADIEGMLGHRGEVLVIERDFKRYVGAQIGIYNPKGEKVGAVSHLENKEYLYVVSDDTKALQRVRSLYPVAAPIECAGEREPEAVAKPSGTIPTGDPIERGSRGASVLSGEALDAAITRVLGSKDAMRVDELASSLNLPAPELRRHLVGLIDEGRVRKSGQTRGTRYHLVRGVGAPASPSESTTARQQQLFPLSK